MLTSVLAAAAGASGYLPLLNSLVPHMDQDLMKHVTALVGSAGGAYVTVYCADKAIGKTASGKQCVGAPKGAIGARILDAMRYLNRHFLARRLDAVKRVHGPVVITAEERADRIREGLAFLRLCKKVSGVSYEPDADLIDVRVVERGGGFSAEPGRVISIRLDFFQDVLVRGTTDYRRLDFFAEDGHHVVLESNSIGQIDNVRP